MIIDFTVSNYRSIKEPVTLSFVAQKRRSTKGEKNSTTPTDDSICAGYEVKGRDFKLLPVAAVFGANASGKSNVIRASGILTRLMTHSVENKQFLLKNVTPFRLANHSLSSPTDFEVRMLFQESLFTYKISIYQGEIIEERLDYSPPPSRRQSNRLLFSRELNRETGMYRTESGDSFAGAHLQLINKMEKHQPYLFLLHKLEIPLIEPLSTWLAFSATSHFPEFDNINVKFAASLCDINPTWKNAVIEMLKAFDTGISNVAFKKNENGDDMDYQISILHDSDTGSISWDISEESWGTQKLLSLMGWVFPKLSFPSAVVIDELGANFHPKITREIIRLFHSRETNPKGSQLIFTSHDNTLWRGVLRRDEIWLTEKGADQATKLTPLSAYKPRNDLALDKAYLDGRFGGVPIIGDVEEAFEKAGEEKELVDAA